MAEKAQLIELAQFLKPTVQLDIKGVALEYIAGLTASEKDCTVIAKTDSIVSGLLLLLVEDKNEEIKRDCIKIFINLLSDPEPAKELGLLDKEVIYFLAKYILNEKSKYADDGAMLLNNLTRCEGNCSILLAHIESFNDISLPDFVDAFCIKGYNKNGNGLSHIGSFLTNMTLLDHARKLFLDKERCVIQRLLPYTSHMESIVRRAAAARTIKNLSFETEYHEWLLGSDIDVLPHLLLPLAGPEEIPENEMDQLPIDLQYLPEDKEREPDAEIRRILVETLLQLCTRKYGREKLRDNGVYFVMRELHQVEKNEQVEAALETLIHILIGDEPEESMENLKQVNIPEDVKERFEQIDAKGEIAKET